MSTESSLIQYDECGAIIGWGDANATTLVDVPDTPPVLRVEARSVLYVSVSMRNNCRAEWKEVASFMVEHWEQTYPHFLRYRCNIVAPYCKWDIENWIWTRQNGWQPEDYL